MAEELEQLQEENIEPTQVQDIQGEQVEQIDQVKEPTQQPPSKVTKLYNNLLKDGYTKENLGSEDDFIKMATTKEGATKLHANLLKDGYTESNLGDLNSFMSNLVSQPPVQKFPTLESLGIDNKNFYKPSASDATYVAKKMTGEKIEQVEKYKKNLSEAIDNTTNRALAKKGIKAQPNSPIYNAQKKKVEDAVKNGDAVYSVDPVTKTPALSQTTGFVESFWNALKTATTEEDESDDFVNKMTTKERLKYVQDRLKKMQPTKEGYVGEVATGITGKAGELLGGVTPFMTKATAGAMAGAGLIALAPETAGASLAGIPTVLGFAATTPSAVNQGGKDEVVRRFDIIKKQNPNLPDIEIMKEAEKGLINGEITGGLTNLLFMGLGTKPLAPEAKATVGKFLEKTLASASHVGATVAGTKTGQEIVAGIEDKKLRETPKQIITNAVDNFTQNFTVGAALHTLTNLPQIPGAVKSSIKYALAKENPVELAAILKNNETIGNVPPGTTEKVMSDIEGYNEALNKTSENLTPETQASVAGLIQKRDNLVSEMGTKDPTQVESYQEQIDALNEQIKKITNTNDPFSHEINELGQTLNGDIAEAPLQKGVEEAPISTEEIKTTQYDTENITGIPGEIGRRQEPIQTQPIEGGGTQATSSGGVLQENEPSRQGEMGKEAQGEIETQKNLLDISVKPFSKAVDLIGEPRQTWMYEATESEVEQSKNKETMRGSQYYPKKILSIENAINKGKYEKAIQEGRLTAKDAKQIIESAGLEVPKNIEDLTKAELPVPSEKIQGKTKTFSIDNKEDFYHGSYNKREGKLRTNTAQQFGDAIYFTTSKEEAEGGYPYVTKVKLNIENPIYAGEGKWNEVEKLALEKENANKERNEDGKIIGEVLDLVDIENAKNISDAAKELGYDAIILRGEGNHQNETAVLDPSKIIYPEDMPKAELPVPSEKIQGGEVAPKEKTFFHGGRLDSEGDIFLTPNKEIAKEYASINDGKVKSFSLDENKIMKEDEVRDLIKEMGLKNKEENTDFEDLLLHELLDPRFDTSLSKEDINKVKEEVKKRGYDAISYNDEDITGKSKFGTESIIVINNEAIQPTRKKVSGAAQPVSEVPKGQEIKAGVQPSTEPVSGRGAEATTPVLEKVKQNKDNQSEFTTSSGRQKVNRVGDELVVTDAKTGEKVSRKTYNKAVREYIDNFDFTHGEEGESTTQSEDVNKMLTEVVESSNNPQQIAQIYAENDVPFVETAMTKEGMIAEYGLGDITLESYRRYGDINKLTRGIRANYFEKKGGISMTIDSIAKDMSEHYFPEGDGTEITPNDIVDFMENYDTRKKLDAKFAPKNPLLDLAKQKFKKLTGLELTREVADKAFTQKIEKETQAEQNLLKQDYENAKQLEDEYWKQYEATDGFTKEVSAIEVDKGKEGITEEGTKVEVPLAENPFEKVPKTQVARDKYFQSTFGENANKAEEIYNKYKDTNDFEAMQKEMQGEKVAEQPPIPPVVEKGKIEGYPEELKGITMEDNAKRRAEIGMPERQANPESVEQWRAEAEKKIADGYNINTLIEKMERGDQTDKVENEISRIFAATLDEAVKRDPSNENINAYERLIKAREKSSTEIGRALRSLQGLSNPLENISDFFVAKKEANKVDNLTDAQKQEVIKDFESIQKAKEEYEKNLKEAQAKFAEMQAQYELLKQQKESQKGKIFTKEGKRDFGAERQSLKDELKNAIEKYKNNANKLGISSDGGAENFAITVEMAKIIGKIAKSHVEEVGAKLADVTKRTFDDVKDLFDGITEKDIHDVIAGKYSERKESKSELLSNLRQVQAEAKLLNELDRVLAKEPKNEKQRIEKNQKLAELRKQINEVKKKGGLEEYSEEAKIERATKAVEENIKNIEDKLAKNELDVTKAEKVKSPELELLRKKQKQLRDELEAKRKEAGIGKYSEEAKIEKATKAVEDNIKQLKDKLDKNELEVIEAEKAKSPKLDSLRKEQKKLRDELEAKRKEAKVGKYSEEAKAKRAIEANKRKEEKLRERIKNEDFEPEEKKQSIYDSKEFKQKNSELYKKLLDSQIKVQEAELEFHKKLVENEMANMGKVDKFKNILTKARGTLKAVFAGIDDSAVGVQNWVQAVVNPVIGVKALKNHVLDFWSQKRFDRYLAELHNSEDWNMIKESGLQVSEPKSLLEEGKEEMFPTRFKAIIKINGKEYGKINIGGKQYELFDVLKPFERAFTSLGNSFRVIKFRTEAEKMYSKGITFENNPEEFKKLATRINAMTSASEPNKAFKSDLLNLAVWSPRLMTSKLNILGISDLASYTPLVKQGYYRSLGEKGKVLSKQQLYAAADLAKFATSVVAGSYLYAAARGGKVNTNPYDDDFLDIKLPNGKSYNFTGGYSKYIGKIFQITSGGKVSRQTGQYEKYGAFKDRGSEILHFMRGKMPPVTGSIINLAIGRDYTGKETSLSVEAEKYKAPMAVSQIAGQIEKDGYSSLFMDGIPTFLGINVKDERDYSKPNPLFDKSEVELPEFKTLIEKGIEIPSLGNKSKYKVDKDAKHPEEEMSDEEFDAFKMLVNKYMKEGYNDEEGKETPSIKDVLDMEFKVTKYNKQGEEEGEEYVVGKNLSKEKLKEQIDELKSKAVKKAKKEMGLISAKERIKVTKEE